MVHLTSILLLTALFTISYASPHNLNPFPKHKRANGDADMCKNDFWTSENHVANMYNTFNNLDITAVDSSTGPAIITNFKMFTGLLSTSLGNVYKDVSVRWFKFASSLRNILK